MEIHKEILNNINTRYVLLRKGNNYVIVDKNRRTMVVIDDPIINFTKLIKSMLESNVVVYENPNDLPVPSETLVAHKTIPSKYKLFIKRIYDKNSKETGAVISALTDRLLDRQEKERIEKIIEQYAFTVLYPREGLNMYSDTNFDTASMTIIKGINNLPYENIDGEQTEVFDW
jgi:hypothetical protein